MPFFSSKMTSDISSFYVTVEKNKGDEEERRRKRKEWKEYTRGKGRHWI